MTRPSATVIRELERIYESNHGTLTPRLVVAAARDPSNPLHGSFEWDRDAGFEAHLLDQAADLIRTAKIRIITGPDEPVTEVRAFINVISEAGEHGYVPYRIVTDDAVMRERALAEMELDWRRLERKWRLYAEFWSLVRESTPV